MLATAIKTTEIALVHDLEQDGDVMTGKCSCRGVLDFEVESALRRMAHSQGWKVFIERATRCRKGHQHAE